LAEKGTRERRFMLAGFIGPAAGFGAWLLYVTLAC
jgi:hypothetical protein